MPKIEIYTTAVCPYCIRAKALLEAKGVSYTEIRVDQDPKRMKEAVSRSGGRMTVPQIFINGKHVGGCDDLVELDSNGTLDTLLSKE